VNMHPECNLTWAVAEPGSKTCDVKVLNVTIFLFKNTLVFV
jgi:hypothetical protein